MKSVKEKAYAKINLTLDVTSRREDGFHDVLTVMHTLSLCDELTVTVSPSRTPTVSLELSCEHRLPTDDRNIAVKAAKLYQSRAGITDSVAITLAKRIPVAAGLAGGSTDAAATLRALNRIYGKRLSDKMLLSLAAELGSDVPFCLIGGTALCRGRGERIDRLPDLRNLSVVVAIADGEHVSTPDAYTALDKMYSNFDGSIPTVGAERTASLIESIKTGRLDTASLYNVFEDAILPACPGAAAIKEKMLELGATASLMSGSGPSVFGIFDSDDAAKSAREQLSLLGYRAFFATSA